MLFLQTEKAVKTNLLLTPFHDKAVCIKQKEKQNELQETLSYLQNQPCICLMRQNLHQIIMQNGGKNEMSKCRKNNSCYIWIIYDSVRYNSLYRHFGHKRSFFHTSSPSFLLSCLSASVRTSV